MRIVAFLLLALLIATVNAQNSAPTSAQPSFDCKRAKSPAEIAICSDPKLAALDRELLGLYQQAKAAAADKKAFEVERERAWRERETTCHDAPCVERWLRERVAHYRATLGQKGTTASATAAPAPPPSPTVAPPAPAASASKALTTVTFPKNWTTVGRVSFPADEAVALQKVIVDCAPILKRYAVTSPAWTTRVPLADFLNGIANMLVLETPGLTMNVLVDGDYLLVFYIDPKGRTADGPNLNRKGELLSDPTPVMRDVCRAAASK